MIHQEAATKFHDQRVILVGVAALYSAFGALAKRQASGRQALDFSAVGPPLEERVAVPEVHDVDGARVVDFMKRWIFVSPDCPGCGRAKEMLQQTTSGDLGGGVIVVCRGSRDETVGWAADVPRWVSVVSDEHGHLFSTFNVEMTPYYVLLDDAGACVAKGVTDVTLLAQVQDSDRSRRRRPASRALTSSAAGSAVNGRKEER